MARIPSGMRKKENGLFEKRFTVNGKRYSAYGHTVKECTDNETEIREAIKAGLYSSNKNITLDAYFDEWEKSRIGVVKNSSINETRSKYDNHIKPALGKTKIQKIEKRYLEIRSSSPSRFNPAAARISPLYSPPSSLFNLVSTFPRILLKVASGYICCSCRIRL